MDEASQQNLLVLGSGLIVSVIFWLATRKRFTGFRYDLLRLFIVAAATAGLVIDWNSAAEVIVFWRLIFDGRWLIAVSAVYLILIWWIVISVLYFISARVVKICDSIFCNRVDD